MKVGQISDFMSLNGLTLVPWRDAYTFEQLENAPDFSIAGKALLPNFIATETYEGEPWEVFEANDCVYNFNTGLLVSIDSITQTSKLTLAGNRYISPGLLLPGTVLENGKVKSYSGWFSWEALRWRYSEVSYV